MRCGRRGQLPVNRTLGRLVARRIGQAGRGRRADRYAVFPETCRLVIDDRGAVTIYDTGSQRIFGIAQAQSSDQTLSFTSQDGLVKVSDLQTVGV
jgi:hypothetical protein